MSLYAEKNDYFLNELKLNSTSSADFYRDIFPAGSFETRMGKLDIYPNTRKGGVYYVNECIKCIDNIRPLFLFTRKFK